MKKRLRKKKHRGEFTEWGCQLIVTRKQKGGFEEFLDALIEEAVEAHGCYCGGGGKEDKLDLVVELGRLADNPQERLQKITAWLDTRPDVQDYRIGKMFDVWHGTFADMAEEIE